MAKFLTTTGTSYHIENIIQSARKKLVLVTPYLQLSKTLFERLKDAARKNVKIIIIYGKDELKPSEKELLSEIENVNLYFFNNLHAKCYFNETEMVITSMNMYEFSEKNNREMGVYVTKLEDSELFASAVNETSSIIQSSHQEEVSILKQDITSKVNEEQINYNPFFSNKRNVKGTCIRCGVNINYDPNRPFCRECFSIWYQFENPDYEENFCHACGIKVASSMDKPLCYNCYKTMY